MTNLTKGQVNLGFSRGKTRSFLVKDATQLYAGALVGTDANGFLDNMADTAGLKFAGVLMQDVLGATATGVEGIVDVSGVTLQNVAIAGIFVQADVNSLIYSGDGNPNTCTKTAATNVKAIGWASRFRSAGFGDVTLFTPEEHLGLN